MTASTVRWATLQFLAMHSATLHVGSGTAARRVETDVAVVVTAQQCAIPPRPTFTRSTEEQLAAMALGGGFGDDSD